MQATVKVCLVPHLNVRERSLVGGEVARELNGERVAALQHALALGIVA
jgi:hypothetical protein